MALIEYVGNQFSVAIPSDWIRIATPHHLVVFLDAAPGGSGATITVSRHGVSAKESAGSAIADHQARYASYELIHESVRPCAVYRRFRWRRDGGAGVVQHQLFVDGLVVTCSREEGDDPLDEAFGVAIQSFRIRSGEVTPSDQGASSSA